VGVKVYERMLDLFEAEGIRTLIGIPDPNFVHMFLEAERRGWQVVAPHHEETAGFIADAISRMSGKPAVCIATLGPGIANAAGSMMCALVERTPVIFIGGQRARITEQRVRRGRIQFIKQMGLFENSVKYSASIEYGEQVDEIVREAIRNAVSGVPGPCYIEYPQHTILEDLDVPPVLPPERYRLVNQSAGANELQAALAAIQQAKAPIILAGHGVHTSRGGAAVGELAKLMGCPIVQTSGGTSFIEGVEDRTFPYGFSQSAVEAVVKSDLCIAIGTELGEPVHFGRWRHWEAGENKRTWIYVEQDASAIGVNRPIDIPLIGDLRAIVPQLVAGLQDNPLLTHPDLERWIEEDAQRLATLAAEAPRDGERMHTAAWVVEATKAFPKDGIMVRDGGATVIFQWTYSQCKPHDVIWNQNFGHLGTGLPYALGASIADGGQRPVMLLTSDSAFLFHIGELEVAARLNMPMVVVVGVDHQWGLEVGVYKRTFGHGTEETGVHWSKDVRFDKIAEGLGCQGRYVDRADDLGPAITEAFASGKPTVIHVPIDPAINSEEMPNYGEFRTWYAEGQQ